MHGTALHTGLLRLRGKRRGEEEAARQRAEEGSARRHWIT